MLVFGRCGPDPAPIRGGNENVSGASRLGRSREVDSIGDPVGADAGMSLTTIRISIWTPTRRSEPCPIRDSDPAARCPGLGYSCSKRTPRR